MITCYTCFKEFDESYDMCPHCGTTATNKPTEPIHLIPGTILQERYLLGQAVGSGGFGIIYRAYDLKLETVIAVKEFFSPRLMTRAAGESKVIVSKKNEQEFLYRKERFLAEARNMAKFGDHRSIPNVFEFFEENGTAYIVMELLNGMGLNSMLSANNGKIDRDFSIHVINEVGQALKSLHEKGIIHRDVAPDNVYICSDKDLKVKLLDLGAAKLSSDDDTVVDIILKPGYSPTEQYDNTGAIGTWTDVYALGATLYVLLTGIKPQESTSRKQKDVLVPPIEIDDTISENLSNAVMKAMAIDKHMRFRTVDEFLKAINGERKVLTLEKEKKKRKKHQIIGLSSIAAVLAAAGIFLYGSYSKMEEEELLAETTISIWYSADVESSEQRAMEYVVNDFQTNFTNVTLEVTQIPNAEYADRIKDAYEQGALPTLFESTNLGDEILVNANDLTAVLESQQAAACLFLDKYDSYYLDRKRIPLGVEIPLAMVITNGVSSVAYEGETFSTLDSFGNANVAFDSNAIDLLKETYEISKYNENDFGGINGPAGILITSSMNIDKRKANVHSYEDGYAYEWKYLISDTNPKARYVYEWSVCADNDNQIMAAERLIMWMLGNNYQSKLMVNYAQNGEIPVNAEQFEAYMEGSVGYSGLSDIVNNYDFSR